MKLGHQVLPLLLSIGLFGCQSNNSQSSEKHEIAENMEQLDTTNRVKQIVRIATETNYPPYGFKDEYGNITGFDIELLQAIGDDQSFDIDVYNDDWELIFDKLDNGERDIIAAGITYSERRADNYLLSKPYAPLPSTLVYIDQELDIKSLNDLTNLNVGVLSNSTAYRMFTENDRNMNALIQYPTIFLAVQAMAQGNVDVVAGDSAVIRYKLNEIPELQPTYFEYERIGDYGAWKVLVVGKEYPGVLSQLNHGLDNIKKNGVYGELTKKWFAIDFTQLSIEQENLPKPKGSESQMLDP